MLRIVMPHNCVPEREWICEVIFDRWLGVPYTIAYGDGTTTQIEACGKTLILEDTFFRNAQDNWLSSQCLPGELPDSLDVSHSEVRHRVVRPRIPILFGNPRWEPDAGNDSVYLGLDVLGSAFFMLSRYEEAVSQERDLHGRFPAKSSLAFRHDFLDRPIVDEYVEILWTCMQSLWPELRRRSHVFRMAVTCDVDQPYHPGATSIRRTLRRIAGQVYRRQSLAETVRPALHYVRSRSGDWSLDPYYFTVDWMMDVNEAAGNRVSFYFIPEVTDPVMDDTCPIGSKAVRAMLRRIAHRGHEIGIHPGYRTCDNAGLMKSGLHQLNTVLQQEGIAQTVQGGRQHYLRWNLSTPGIWNEAGISYDSTLGYADVAGFRCGTAREYPMYDLHGRRPLGVSQRPLIVMEGTIFEYMGMGVSEKALQKFIELKRAAQIVKGNYVLLWHNSSFEHAGARELYSEVIRG